MCYFDLRHNVSYCFVVLYILIIVYSNENNFLFLERVKIDLGGVDSVVVLEDLRETDSNIRQLLERENKPFCFYFRNNTFS